MLMWTLPQPINQGEVVKYFATRPEHALLFTQSTLSRKLQQRSEMEAHVDSHPSALSSKRPQIVTSPDVEHVIEGCRMFEEKSMLVCTEGAFEIVQAAHRYQGHLQRMSRG